MPTIKLTKQESEQYFYDALCNGFDYFSTYGISVTFDPKHLSQAHKELTLEDNDKVVCREDVWMKALRNGHPLKLIDDEYGEYSSTITIKDIHERVCLTPQEHLLDMIQENDDAITADCILQSVFFKEVIFG